MSILSKLNEIAGGKHTSILSALNAISGNNEDNIEDAIGLPNSQGDTGLELGPYIDIICDTGSSDLEYDVYGIAPNSMTEEDPSMFHDFRSFFYTSGWGDANGYGSFRDISMKGGLTICFFPSEHNSPIYDEHGDIKEPSSIKFIGYGPSYSYEGVSLEIPSNAIFINRSDISVRCPIMDSSFTSGQIIFTWKAV